MGNASLGAFEPGSRSGTCTGYLAITRLEKVINFLFRLSAKQVLGENQAKTASGGRNQIVLGDFSLFLAENRHLSGI